MSLIRLRLNANKTQFIWFGTRQQLARRDLASLASISPSLISSDPVRDLGVFLDSELTMDAHIKQLCQSCFYQLQRLRVNRHCLSRGSLLTLACAFICNRINYCNGVLCDNVNVNVNVRHTDLAPLNPVTRGAACSWVDFISVAYMPEGVTEHSFLGCNHQSTCMPSYSLYVQLLWYPMYYPGGMKASVSPVQWSEPYSILAPTPVVLPRVVWIVYSPS